MKKIIKALIWGVRQSLVQIPEILLPLLSIVVAVTVDIFSGAWFFFIGFAVLDWKRLPRRRSPHPRRNLLLYLLGFGALSVAIYITDRQFFPAWLALLLSMLFLLFFGRDGMIHLSATLKEAARYATPISRLRALVLLLLGSNLTMATLLRILAVASPGSFAPDLVTYADALLYSAQITTVVGGTTTIPLSWIAKLLTAMGLLGGAILLIVIVAFAFNLPEVQDFAQRQTKQE